MKAKVPARPAEERILDAAEQSFATRGFHGVTLREISRAAASEATLIERRFGGKRELLAAVLERRAVVLERERRALLASAQESARPGSAAIEAILNAYCQPLIEHAAQGGLAWRNYCVLSAAVSCSAELAPIVARPEGASAEPFITALRAALPQCAARELYWGFEFLSAALVRTCAENGLLAQLGAAAEGAAELDGVRARLVAYAAAGLRALGAVGRPGPRGKRVERRAQPRR
jgi:AcrR family transcriptional regulator